jgi:hypothetical protein
MSAMVKMLFDAVVTRATKCKERVAKREKRAPNRVGAKARKRCSRVQPQKSLQIQAQWGFAADSPQSRWAYRCRINAQLARLASRFVLAGA